MPLSPGSTAPTRKIAAFSPKAISVGSLLFTALICALSGAVAASPLIGLTPLFSAGLVVGMMGLPAGLCALLGFLALGDWGQESERYALGGDSADEKEGRRLVDGMIGERKRYVSAYMVLIGSHRAQTISTDTRIDAAGVTEPLAVPEKELDAQRFALAMWRESAESSRSAPKIQTETKPARRDQVGRQREKTDRKKRS